MPRQSIENRLASLEKESAERLAGLEKEVQELKRQLTECRLNQYISFSRLIYFLRSAPGAISEDFLCLITFPGILGLFLLASQQGQQKQMLLFLTQCISHGSLRELLERRHFCHNTFRDYGKNGLSLQTRPRKMVTLRSGKELCQSALVLHLQCFDTWKRISSNAKRIDSNDTERISFEELRADVREIKTGVLELQVRYPAHEEYVTDRLNDFEAHVNERLDTVENHLTRLTDIAVDHKAGIEQLHASQQTLQAGQEQILAILNKQTKTND